MGGARPISVFPNDCLEVALALLLLKTTTLKKNKNKIKLSVCFIVNKT